ncbi:MarR family winged helix-turn-helix transcriptional regulator [Glycomyces sp. YM15]|uniref:MarR family winged helix-turn-helix transcriptional regulator n=1 Tax=Glycomyces sp. YM15 TaxID=2800446 RepID=UPI001964B1DC|nr:MarR family transcriptional regulator [Glycomyces sp. YM15]
MSDEAPWLDESEMATWLAFIGVVMRLPGTLEVQLRRDADLNHFEYSVLVFLEHAEGGTLRMSDLAFLCNGSLSRLSHVARRLENDGLIERFACPDDGRSTLARLTDAGRERLVKAAPGHVRLVRELVFDELDPDEMRQMGEFAKRILARIQA